MNARCLVLVCGVMASLVAACDSTSGAEGAGGGGGAGGGAGGGGPDEATCEAPGEPTTPLPSAEGATSFNVTPLACTRTATALACELDASHDFDAVIEGDKRVIVANGLPDHDVGAFPNDGNPNAISEQSYAFEVPVSPSGAGSSNVKYFGVLTSGVVLDPGTAEAWNDSMEWRYEALRYGTATPYFGANGGTDATFHPNGLGLDCNLAHVQPNGAYHYHGIPTSLLPATPEVTFVGWAADGYPIVVLYDHEDPADASSPVRAMRSSYALKVGERPSGDEGPGGTYDGTFGADWEYVAGGGDLDECNGREGVVPIDGEQVSTYHYVLTSTFPFIPRCWKAAPDASFSDAGGGPPPGAGPPPGG